MKKYRIAYDYVFSARDFDKGFHYKGEHINSIAFYATFRVVNKATGEEEIFNKDKKLEYAKNKFCYLSDFYQCEINKDELFKMIPNKKLFDKSNYDVTFEISKHIKWLEPAPEQIVVEPIDITYWEFVDILKNNFSEFDNSHNKPTQKCTSYYLDNSYILP